ncbi:uncharacterized protein LOC142980602 isoform X2 [Anticarsia gemmatalis]|uniref:uncharacterized protein LOC142980602 isoform X2 n=1 Tax=Anticarsia gemmatalis TaxID=129554 RepID=UPI003F76B828
MLLKRNLIECTTIISCTGTLICVLLNYVTDISPITGIWFPLYILTLFIVSLCVSFKFIQWLLRLNKPIKYDLEGIIKDYPYLTFLSRVLPQSRRPPPSEWCEYDTNELSVISTVLERKLVSSWYVPFISQEIGFPFACKQMLDQIIGKSFKISNKIESKDVFVDLSTILASHLKEYQKAVKRHEKTPTSAIDTLYKKSHPIFDENNKKIQSADHCTNILRIVFKELVPWELWDTPHSELLVRILSKKLDNFIDNTLADPEWLNDKLLMILKGKSEPNVTEERKETIEIPQEIPLEKKEESVIESTLTSENIKGLVLPNNVEGKEEPLVEPLADIVEEMPVMTTEPVDIKTSPVLRQRRGRQGRNEVKIYDRIIEGSVKTWETDIDLQCISLGQDLLASLDGEITLSRLWGQDADADGSPNPPRSKSPQPLWFGEEETIEVDPIDSSPHKDKKENSPKPTELLKDLQTTVSQAKTKIGDLQDEAAGMMEGLLDFGIAGLKKGLRFTGLSDDSQEKSPSHHRSDKTPPSEVPRPKPIQEFKDVHANNNQRDDNASVPPLLKQQRVISQDSVPSQARSAARSEPVLVPLADSPEPEYEEAADLSTSIAKLRCLLQQRADASPRAEEVWWESAEETRGRTHHHHSTRPVDTATLADEYDMNLERNSSPSQTSNNMQRLDKLFQRTVTGVFNSIKTAVGAEGEEPPRTLHDWTYVCTSIELSVCGAVARLVGGRRAYTHVDAALDSLQQLAPAPAARPATPEDFDEWCGSRGACWCGAGAAAAGAGLATSHVAHRLATVLLADLTESLLECWLSELGAWLRRQVFALFEQVSERDGNTFPSSDAKRRVDIDETCRAVLDSTPGLLNVFGEETVSAAARLLISSFTHKEINKDLIFRALDLIAGHFKKAAGLRNPSFDNN